MQPRHRTSAAQNLIWRIEFTGKGESLILGRPILKRRKRRRNGGHGVGNTDILLRFLRFKQKPASPSAPIRDLRLYRTLGRLALLQGFHDCFGQFCGVDPALGGGLVIVEPGVEGALIHAVAAALVLDLGYLPHGNFGSLVEGVARPAREGAVWALGAGRPREGGPRRPLGCSLWTDRNQSGTLKADFLYLTVKPHL